MPNFNAKLCQTSAENGSFKGVTALCNNPFQSVNFVLNQWFALNPLPNGPTVFCGLRPVVKRNCQTFKWKQENIMDGGLIGIILKLLGLL